MIETLLFSRSLYNNPIQWFNLLKRMKMWRKFLERKLWEIWPHFIREYAKRIVPMRTQSKDNWTVFQMIVLTFLRILAIQLFVTNYRSHKVTNPFSLEKITWFHNRSHITRRGDTRFQCMSINKLVFFVVINNGALVCMLSCLKFCLTIQFFSALYINMDFQGKKGQWVEIIHRFLFTLPSREGNI